MSSRNPLAGLRFRGRWRHYQELALEAFDAEIAGGRDRTHLVAPPGSGKTLLGVEMIRRLALPALVLSPNSAVQAQWPASVRRFVERPDDARMVAGTEPGFAIACLTYQSLCRLDDPTLALGRVAEQRWAEQRAKATGDRVDRVKTEALAWTGEAEIRRKREVARITGLVKREIARGEHEGIDLGQLLSGAARERLDALRRAGVRTVVLDECHHLASLWGYVIREVVEALGPVHLIGLTATPPEELTSDEKDLYEGLLGPVDFSVPTPAVVRDGFLAPYQELAWLTEPLESEREWLEEHDVRFRELVTQLHDDPDGGRISFPEWVITRLRHRELEGGVGELTWERFQKSRPALARAGVRFLASAGLELPDGAPRGEGYRRPPDLDDWLVLLEDYALRCLAADSSAEAAARYQAVGAALRDLGFQLTRQGIRRGASDVDRLLTASASKSIGLVEVLAAENESRGDNLRALVLCDSELESARPDPELSGVLDPAAGTARNVVRAIGEDLRTAPLRPLLVSGRGLRCLGSDADVLLAALRREEGGAAGLERWWAEREEGGLVRLLASGFGWQPRLWVGLATQAFTSGATQVLVGTRALLGEGWDCPAVNCLVDLTAATTGVSVRQMRGRSLRLDPDDPEKIASNWDVVCVAPALARGEADYERFVRKHMHLYAPAEDGVIEAGPSHVHPALGPFGAPAAGDFGEINRTMRVRAADRDDARERWGIGEPYVGHELRTVVVKSPAANGPPPRRREQAPRYRVSQRLPLAAAGAGVAGALGAAAFGEPAGIAAVALVPAGLGWSAARLGRASRQLPPVVPLDLVAHAVAEAYWALGELSGAALASLSVEPRASGYLRCLLAEATPPESERFARALDQALGPVEAPRYLVSRLAAPPGRGGLALLGLTLARRRRFDELWHAVPDDLGRNRHRAAAYAKAWTRWLGPSRLMFTQRSDEGRRALADAASQLFEYETHSREVWV